MIDKLISDRIPFITESIFSELFSSINNPEVISLASGAVGDETLPTAETIISNVQDVYNDFGINILQYQSTKGLPLLTDSVSTLLTQKRMNGLAINSEQISIVPGSLSVVDLIGKVFLNENDIVIIPEPIYFTTLLSLRIWNPKIITVSTNEDGINIDELKKIIVKYRTKIKLLAVNPNFTNPSGITYSKNNREQIANLALNNNFIIFEDDPYFDLRYSGDNESTIFELASDNTIYTSSFSKIFAPGIRVGYYVMPKRFQMAFEAAQQDTYLHSSSIDQAIIYEFMKDQLIYDKQIINIKNTYARKLHHMLSELERLNFSANCEWNIPSGGMFIWLKNIKNFKAKKMFNEAVNAKVVYVPGEIFFNNSKGHENTMRLNFTKATEIEITEGLKRLKRLFDSVL